MLEHTKDEVLTLLKKSVRPEFVNRIDEIIMFSPLSRQEIIPVPDGLHANEGTPDQQ